MTFQMVTCPLCCQPGFNTPDALSSALVDAATRKLSCPVCHDTFIGLDKLTIHLFAHNSFVKGPSGEFQNGVLLKPNSDVSFGNTVVTNPVLYFQAETGQLFALATSSLSTQEVQAHPIDHNTGMNVPCGVISTNNNVLMTSGKEEILVEQRKNDFSPVQQLLVSADIPAVNEETTPGRPGHQPPLPGPAADSGTHATDESAGITSSSRRLMSCNVCDLSFSNKAILAVHKQLSHKNSSSKLSGMLKNEKPSKTSLSCNWCSASFNLKSSLLIHVKVTHPGQKDGERKEPEKFSCQNCDKTFFKESILHQHLKAVHGEKPWQCSICSKSFTTKYFLRKHKRIHTGETPYACSICHKVFTFQQSYHKHMLYHTDDKPYCCSHCGRLFKELSTLNNHERIHSGEKPFTCETCGKSFRQRVSYLVHRRIHTGVMPYKCTACNKSFRYKISQRTHKCPEYPPGIVVKTNLSLVDRLQEDESVPSKSIALCTSERESNSLECLNLGQPFLNPFQNSQCHQSTDNSSQMFNNLESSDDPTDPIAANANYCNEKTSKVSDQSSHVCDQLEPQDLNGVLNTSQKSSAIDSSPTESMGRLRISSSEFHDPLNQQDLRADVLQQNVSFDDIYDLDLCNFFFDPMS